MMPASPSAVEFKSVSRIYSMDSIDGKNSVLRANDKLSFTIAQGSIHGLIGENGAGKSTAMKILFGLEQADEGEILLFGKKVRFNSATEAMNSGISMVHQHFMLSENETALENFMLMQKNSAPFSWRSKKQELNEAKKLSKNFGLEIPWEKLVQDLSVGEQQRLEILKALSQNGKILILDEPTAVLTPYETQDLFKKLKDLKSQGYTIILITHKLKEVLQITDYITVMQKGKVTTSLKTTEATVEILTEKMIGKSHENFRLLASSAPQASQKRLHLSKINVEHSGSHLEIENLSVNSGEIVGVAGVEGNGQKELLKLLLHPKKFKKISGEIEILGKDTKKFSTQQLRQLSIGIFPEDRLRYGSVLNLNLLQNFILGYQRKFFTNSFLFPWKKALQICLEQIQKFNVVPGNPQARFSSLSGGNQQKLVAARELFLKPDLLLVSQPTRGVDVGASAFIHQQILAARNSGAAILLISSELDELIHLSDRVIVLYRGRIQAEFSRLQFSENKIGAAMGGIS